ncbi:MAG TPA: PAS domain S-box protein [Anaerolineae bacterium]
MVLQPVGEHFSTLVEHSSDAIALISAEGTVLYASPATTRILGYAIDEFVGRNALEFVHPEDQAYVVSLLSDLVQSDRAVFSGEFRYRHKDGSWRWIEGVGNNLLAEPGVGAIVANYRDVTERKQTEAVQLQLAAIVESSNDAIISKTLDGIITSWNPAAERLYGYQASEVVGRSVGVIIPPDRMEEWQGIMGQVRRGECIHHFETVRLRGMASRLMYRSPCRLLEMRRVRFAALQPLPAISAGGCWPGRRWSSLPGKGVGGRPIAGQGVIGTEFGRHQPAERRDRDGFVVGLRFQVQALGRCQIEHSTWAKRPICWQTTSS